ncbi:MAG: DMT family transporter, partial [Caulobacterales bacterium]
MLLSGPVFAAVGIWAWRRREIPVTRAQFCGACGVGLLGYYMASWLDFWGLEFISANLERVILLTYPMFVIFLGALFFRAPLRGYAIGSAFLSYAGLAVLLIFGQEAHHNGGQVMIGALLVFGSGLSYALYQLFAKQFIAALGGSLFTAIAMVAAGAGILTHFAVTHPLSQLAFSAEVFKIGVMLAIFSTVLPAFMISAAIKYAGSQATAIIGTISPLVTILLSVSVLQEHFGWTEALGSALVVGAVAFFTYWDMREQKRQKQLVDAPEV